MTTKGSEIMRTSGGVSWTWLRAVVATVLVGSALVLNPGGAASETGTADDAATELDAELDAELAFAEQILDMAQNPDVEPSRRGIDTARMALDHRRGQVDAELLPLLDQQARNLDTAEKLLALGEPDEENALEYGIAAAKVATGHQAGTLGLDLESVEIEAPESDSPSEAALALVEHAEGDVTGSQLAELQTLDALPEAAQVALTDFIDAFIGFSIATDLAYADADMARIEALLDVMDDPEAALDLVDSVQPRELLADLGVDFTPVFAARNALLDTVEQLRDALLDPEVQQQSAAAPIQLAPYVSIELGTATNNTYSQDFMLLIDVGGDDTYLNNAGGASSLGLRPASALVDFLGADQYKSGRGGGVNGGGFLGSGLLIDGIGADTYVAGQGGTNGGGTIGTGLLLDTLGHNSFSAGSAGANGGAVLGGVGMLIDPISATSASASDSGTNGGGAIGGLGFLLGGWQASNYSAGGSGTNGGGFWGGVGFLLDPLGGDGYSAGSQGTNGGAGRLDTIGTFPILIPVTGGAGFLFDAAGSDTYGAGSDGVNGGGEAGVGMLLDAGGNDSYSGGSNGVNGGGNFGAGFLVDINGNDTYSGGNPGVNGGGSFGTGTLIDGLGSDIYSSSGASSNGAGGFGSGALIDGGGNDRYTGGNGEGFLGTGLLFDAAGTDRYRPNSSSTFVFDQTVVPKGDLGVGAQVDSDSVSPVPTTVPTLPPTTLPVPTTLPTVPPTTLPVPTTTTSVPLPTTTSIPLPTTTTSSSTTTTSTTTSSTTTSSTTTTTTPPSGGGSNVGAGGFTGSVAFEPPGVPPILAPCAPTTFSFDGEAEAFVLNTTIVGYAGPVTFEGGGSSECENATGGSGSLTLSAEGEGPTGSTIVCDSLTGDFSRFLVRAQINLTGDCTINGISTTGILFTADVLVAADGATGITDPVLLAHFAGDFAVSPG